MTTAISAKSLLDAVPEFYPYEDTGCEVSRSCLNCPLPQCKYDDPSWFQRHRRMASDLNVWSTMQSEGLTVEDAARRFSVTVRTVFRIMRRCREAAPELDGVALQVFAVN
tara:strand:- start:103 stop:432 length:330 start_codon:yes stop_codon:yes gene_type:complete